MTIKKLAQKAAAIMYTKQCVRNVLNRIDYYHRKLENERIHHIEHKYIPRMISEEERRDIESSFSISFSGDLILLRNQIYSHYDGDGYSFDSMFDYTRDTLWNTDLSIGVMEGPFSGDENDLTSADFGTKAKLYLNYPDSFLDSIKKAGFDVLTTANNHILDKGLGAALRTIRIIEDKGLHNIGFHRTLEERYNSFLVEKDGIKFGILSYMDGQNGTPNHFFVKGDGRNYVRLLVSRNDRYRSFCEEGMEEDFQHLQKREPDIIIAVCHMGTYGSHETDDFQQFWNNKLVDLGADIIFTASSHTTQPIEWRKKGRKDILIVNGVGNFVNSIGAENDDDASGIAYAYINRATKQITAASVIPLYAFGNSKGQYIAVPIDDIAKSRHIKNEMSVLDLQRAARAEEIVSYSMMGEKLSISDTEARHVVLPNYDRGFRYNCEYVRSEKGNFQKFKERNKDVFEWLNSFDEIIFIGDSITEGTVNCGFGWQYPITENTYHPIFTIIAEGGVQRSKCLRKSDHIKADRNHWLLLHLAVMISDIVTAVYAQCQKRSI